MGKTFFDQYSILHFSVGVIFYFWNIPLLTSFLIHFLFELLENTPTGIYIINNYIYKYFTWPGKKNYADSIINTIGDNIFFLIGWLISSMMDKHYKSLYSFL